MQNMNRDLVLSIHISPIGSFFILLTTRGATVRNEHGIRARENVKQYAAFRLAFYRSVGGVEAPRLLLDSLG